MWLSLIHLTKIDYYRLAGWLASFKNRNLICSISTFNKLKLELSSMASIASMQTVFSTNSVVKRECVSTRSTTFVGSKVFSSFNSSGVSEKNKKKRRPLRVVAAIGDVSSEGTTYLIAGAVAVALVGTAFPILFSRKDLCPECDGAGFIRESGAALRANAARKDQAQIVCPRCNGLGKLNQIDK